MAPAWVGVACLAASWLFGLSYYHGAEPAVWAVLVTAGTLLLSRRPVHAGRPLPAAIAALLVVPALWLAPWPWKAAPLLVVVGLAVGALLPPRRWAQALGHGAFTAGVVLLVQSLLVFLYESVTARLPIVPEALRDLLAATARLAGMDAAVDGPNVVLFAMRRSQPVAATWGLVADPVTLAFLCGGFTLIALGRGGVRGAAGAAPLRAAVVLLALVLVWLPIRAVLLLGIHLHRVLLTDYDAPLAVAAQFWNPIYHAVLLLPPLLAAAFLLHRRRPAPGAAVSEKNAPGAFFSDTTVARARGVWILAAPALVAVAAAALTLAVVWQPSGARKPGRLLIDEHHSELDDWTRRRWRQKNFDTTSTLRPFDTEWHGQDSGYNYATLWEYLSRFYDVGRLREPIRADRLADVDVLVLKIPSKDFSRDEIDAAVDFVARGGGLLLLGEHTNIYGSGTHLNRLAERLGFRFRYDCLFGIDEVFKERFAPPLVPHPVIQAMGPLDFATSCSIDPATSSGRAVIRNTGLKNLGPNYFASNFYPQPVDAPEMIYGSFVQLWATHHGRGRVLAFTDSTIFANFSLFDPGKSELFLGMVEWLGREEAGHGKRWRVLLALLLGAAAVLGAWFRPTAGVLGLGAALFGWAAGAVLVQHLHTRSLPLPKARLPLVRLAFERSLTRTGLPTGGFIGGHDDHFGLFERAVQRLTEIHQGPDRPGRTWTTFRATGATALRGDGVVVILPSEEPDPAFLAALERYVREGGKLLVLDAPENEESTASTLLAPFRLALETARGVRGEAPRAGPVEGPPGWPAITVQSTRLVRGGRPFARVGGEPAAAVLRHGRGTVAVVGFGSRFADRNLGATDNTIPEEPTLRVFGFAYALLRALVDDAWPAE
ncbi:MAG: hypothetical protein JXQ29_18195 [Planctomycetes bacterium]|nr:hypothetical protein [Planctomycetota bacterium]